MGFLSLIRFSLSLTRSGECARRTAEATDVMYIYALPAPMGFISECSFVLLLLADSEMRSANG